MKQYIKRKLRFIKKIVFLFNMYTLLFHRKQRVREQKVFRKLKEIEKNTTKEIYNLQQDKLIIFFKYSYENTKYYKKIFDQFDVNTWNPEDLKKIPILTKDIIRKHGKELLSEEFEKSSLCKRNTGGSTGESLEFYSDNMAGLNDNAHHWYLYSLMGYEKGDAILGCSGTVIPQKLRDKNIYWLREAKNSVWGEYDFSVLYLTDLNIHYYIDKLIALKPTILRGYPSFFDKLATYIIENDIKLGFEIKGINLTGEMCSISQRINIEKAFSSMVYFEYGHTEICLYCYTSDDTYVYKSSPIYGYIEVLKDDGTDVEIGEVGNIIVTGFNNHGMPFVRYDTGDMGELLSRNGGTIEFKKILGRNKDYIVSKDGQKVFLTALIFGQHLQAFKNIVKWQLKQELIGVVSIMIVRNSNYTNSDETEILKNFQSVADIQLKFKYVDEIALTKRGKHLFLKQNIG